MIGDEPSLKLLIDITFIIDNIIDILLSFIHEDPENITGASHLIRITRDFGRSARGVTDI